MTVREFILERFKSKSAQARGGLSPRTIRGSALKDRPFSDAELDDELSRMRKEGELRYVAGLWYLP